jgi:hypothetical protein
MDLLERVPGIYWKEFQVCIGKTVVWATEQCWMWRESNIGHSARICSQTPELARDIHVSGVHNYTLPCQYVNGVSSWALQYTHMHMATIFYDIRIVYIYKKREQVLGALGKLRNATINFVMFVCPSVHMEQLGSH